MKPKIIILIDGGTASQLDDYFYYKILQELYDNVYADLDKYNKNMEKDESPMARPFNLHKLIELDDFKVASRLQSKLYRTMYEHTITEPWFTDCVEKIPSAPVWLGGYPSLHDYEWVELIKKYVKLKPAGEILNESGLEVLHRIESTKSVGVHVRRGDMSTCHGDCYWKVPLNEYFVNVTKIEEFRGYKFFFFSEETDWITDNIIPLIDVEYEVVGANKSKDGYRDLFLLSKCNHQVVSQGSFGQIAHYLNTFEGKRAIHYDETAENLWKWYELPKL